MGNLLSTYVAPYLRTVALTRQQAIFWGMLLLPPVVLPRLRLALRGISEQGFLRYLQSVVLPLLRCLPGAAAIVNAETQKMVAQISTLARNEELDKVDRFGVVTQLPASGTAGAALLEGMRAMRGVEKEYQSGKAFGGIYYDGKELKEAINAAYCMYADSNGLYPNIFPALRKFELEAVRMTASLLHGDEHTCGCLTTGGSESIIVAMKAYRQWGRSRGITDPEVIFCCTAHPAVAKACHILGMRHVLVPYDARMRLDVAAVAAAITPNTVCVFASAPEFSHGVIDDIGGLSDVLKDKNVGLHVDTCLGAFILPWLEQAGLLREGVAFDFRVPAVTTMSADIHKYGYGSKGTSVVMFRTRELRKHMFYAWTEWSGGMYCSPTMTGSRAGGIIAAAWAGLMMLGDDGYRRIALQIAERFGALRDGIAAMPELELVGPPDACCLAFRCKEGPPNQIYKVAAAMKEVGQWNLNYLQKPVCCQIQIGCRSAFSAGAFLTDLREALVRVANSPDKYSGGLAQIYGMAADLGDREVVGDLLKEYLDKMY